MTETITSSEILAIGSVATACITGFCLIKVAQLKSHINSRMDELLDLTKKVAHAEGVADERASARQRESQQAIGAQIERDTPK